MKLMTRQYKQWQENYQAFLGDLIFCTLAWFGLCLASGELFVWMVVTFIR